MKKNGFIATSLLYSFFLVFCALLIALVATYVHNRLLLNNLINNTKMELSDINKRSASKLKVGDYLKMSLFSNERYVNIKDKLWIVESIDDETVNLLSATSIFTMTKISDINIMKNEPNLYYNLYTMGQDGNYAHVNFITKTKLSEIEALENGSIKDALLDFPNEYLCYDDIDSNFYLYNNVNPLVDGEHYPVRLSIIISKNTPILGGKGIYLDPYTLVDYINNDNLILHYNYLNPTGNKGFATGINYITDLSATNIPGQITDLYTNDKTNGITLNGTIDTNLNIFESLKNDFTIELRSYGNFNLSTSTITDFINGTLNLESINLTIEGVSHSFNEIKEAYTISIVKNIDNNIIIYINGEKMDASYPVPTINPSDLLHIGNITNFKSIRIYNRALTFEEISNNYNVDKRWSIE